MKKLEWSIRVDGLLIGIRKETGPRDRELRRLSALRGISVRKTTQSDREEMSARKVQRG